MAESVASHDENKAEKKWASFADSLRNSQTGELLPNGTMSEPREEEDVASPNSRNSSGSTLQPEEEAGFEIVSHNKKSKKTQKQNDEKKPAERRPRAQTVGAASVAKIEKKKEQKEAEPPAKEAVVKEVPKEEPAKPTADEAEHDASNHSSDSAFAENPSPSHGSSTSLHYAADAENQELSDSVVALSDEEKWPELSVATNSSVVRGPLNAGPMSSPVAAKKLSSPKSSEQDDDLNAQRRNSKTHWRRVDIDVSYQPPSAKRPGANGRANRPAPPQSHASLDSADSKQRRPEGRKSMPARQLSQKYNNSDSTGNSDNGAKEEDKERAHKRHTLSSRYDNDTDDSQSNATYTQRSTDSNEKDASAHPTQNYQQNTQQQPRRYPRSNNQQRGPRHSVPTMPFFPLYYMGDPVQLMAAVQQQQQQQQSQNAENGLGAVNGAANNNSANPTTTAAFIPITQSNLFYNVPTANFFMPFPPAALAQFNGQTSMPQYVQPPLVYQGMLPVAASTASNSLPQTSTPTSNGPATHDPAQAPVMAPIAVPPPPVGQFMGMDPFGLPPTSFIHTQQNFGYPLTEGSIQFARDIGALVKKYFPNGTDKVLGDLSSHPKVVENFERNDRLLVLRYQLQFYFSPKNLERDWYLCSRMDPEGFVLLSDIAKFPRVKMLHQEPDDLIDAIQHSDVLELADVDSEMPLIRTRLNPHRWPAPSARKHSETAALAAQPSAEPPARRQTISEDVSVDDVRQRLLKTRIQGSESPRLNGNTLPTNDTNEVFEEDWADVKGKKKPKKGRISHESTGVKN